jgi:hypothetical protein
VRFATSVRELLAPSSTAQGPDGVLASLRLAALHATTTGDSAFGRQLLRRLDGDSSFVRHCLDVAAVQSTWHSAQSKHFIFYFEDDTPPAPTALKAWDNHFERLADAFGTTIAEKVPCRINKAEQYGRCFPPWDVRWGIELDSLGSNSHELVHLLLFRYSDVPFFHEPLAFIYGTYEADPRKVSARFSDYERVIADSGYVSATELLHFPQIIGLDEVKWASAFVYVDELVRGYGIEKLLRLMSMTPWQSSADDFAKNFREVYGVELTEFEQSIRKGLRH